MADTKRLNLGGRVATPRLPPTGMPMEQLLARALGASVRIVTTAAPKPRTLTGYIFALAPSSPLLTLSQTPLPTSASASGAASGASTPVPPTPTSYTVVSLSAIQSFTVLELGPASSGAAPTAAPASGSSTPPGGGSAGASLRAGSVPPPPQPQPLPPLDPATAGQRALQAVGKLQAAEARRGKGVSREAQQLFDALHRTLPVAWDGARIVVLGSVVIAPPYAAQDCKSLRKGGNAQELARVKKVVESERKKIAAANGAGAAPRGGGHSPAVPELKKGG